MNRDRLEHRAKIERTPVTRVNGKTIPGAPQTVRAGVEVWVEGISPQQRRLLIGKRENARYILSWMDDFFQPEDLVTVTNPALGTFLLRNIQHDVQGAYWFGTLEERSA